MRLIDADNQDLQEAIGRMAFRDRQDIRDLINVQPTITNVEDVVVDEMKEGWICPRCGKVNAPFIGSCDCKPDDKTASNADSECLCGYNHHWRIMMCYDNVVGDGVTYICDRCGARKKVYDSEIS